jgi:hypothetical protein
MRTYNVNFGWWGEHGPGPGLRVRVSWNADTGVLYLFHPERGHYSLAVLARREDIDDLMGDWPSLARREGFPGLLARLARAGWD